MNDELPEERQVARDSQLSAMFDGELSAAECDLQPRAARAFEREHPRPLGRSDPLDQVRHRHGGEKTAQGQN